MYSQIQFVVEITDEQADLLYGLAQKKNLELQAWSVDGLDIISLTCNDTGRHFELEELIKLVESSGAKFVRVNLDLVGVPNIAEFAGVNPETVRLWSNGQRRANFPTHYISVGASSFWLWSEVAEWLRANGFEIAADYDYVPLVRDSRVKHVALVS